MSITKVIFDKPSCTKHHIVSELTISGNHVKMINKFKCQLFYPRKNCWGYFNKYLLKIYRKVELNVVVLIFHA